MNLLREYIRELLLRESGEGKVAPADEDGVTEDWPSFGDNRDRAVVADDGRMYNPQGRKQWELSYQFEADQWSTSSGVVGQIRYYPEEDGTWNIKPPGPFPSQFAEVEGFVFHEAHGNTRYGNSVKYGGKVAGVNLAPGQSAEKHYSEDGSIVVVHPELYQGRDDSRSWFKSSEWVAYYKKALEKINTLGGDAFPFAKFQGFIAQAQNPDSEWAKKLKDLGIEEGYIENYSRALYDPGDEDWVLQAKAARKGAEMQGISFELFKWLGAHLDWMKRYYKKSVSEVALLELLDMYEEYRSAPKPDLEDDAAATEAGKELAFQLADAMYMPVFAKGFAKVWRKLNISSREEIKAFSKYARGNRSDGYPRPHELLKKHDETTYPDGIIYEIPDAAYAAFARRYYA